LPIDAIYRQKIQIKAWCHYRSWIWS